MSLLELCVQQYQCMNNTLYLPPYNVQGLVVGALLFVSFHDILLTVSVRSVIWVVSPSPLSGRDGGQVDLADSENVLAGRSETNAVSPQAMRVGGRCSLGNPLTQGSQRM